MTARPVPRVAAPYGLLLRDELRGRLLSGHYPPGTRISIEEVKAEYGVSKQPVMDALRRLEAIGLVNIVPQSGCRVATYSASEVADFFALFARFEGEVAAAAALRRTDDQLVAMAVCARGLVDVEAESEPGRRAAAYRRANREFHLVVHEMADSRIMSTLSEQMWDLSDFLIATVLGPAALADTVAHRNEEHELIRSALTLGQADVARACMESHIRGSIAVTS